MFSNFVKWRVVIDGLINLFPWFSVGMGMAFGLGSYLWLGFIFDDIVIEITLTLSVSYLAYFMVCNFLNSHTINIVTH